MAAWIAVAGSVAVAAAVLASSPGRAGRVAFLPDDDPWVRLDREITREFGMENPVIWLVEGSAGTIWSRPVLGTIVELTRAALRIPGVRAADVMSLASPNLRQVRMSATGIAPAYVMATVPPTDEAVAELRRRVEADPNLAGTLVARDGRAALVVANFPDGADSAALADAALALRDRLAGPDAAIHVVGAPILAREAGRAASGLVWPAGLAAVGAAIAAVAVLGASGLLAIALGAVLALLWSAMALVLVDAVVWPWSGLAVLPIALLGSTATAACLAAGDAVPRWSRVLAIGGATAAGFLTFAIVSGPPAHAFGTAGAVGGLAAAVAGRVASSLAAATPRPRLDAWMRRRRLAAGAAVVAIAAIASLPWIDTSFPLLGYGERYLPARATDGLRSLRRLMPPPTSLAVRVRGESGLLGSPAALAAMDQVVQEVRSDRRVVRAQSVADLVKIVNRTFHDDDPASAVLPAEDGLAARYLALAYSPPFRRFVDRGLGRAAIWIDLATDRPADVAGVLAGVTAAVRDHPIPSATVDLFGGDGAVLVVMARFARRLVAGAAALLVTTVVTVALLLGRRAAVHAAAGGLAAAAVAAGGLVWLGLPADLLSLSCVAGAAAAGAGSGAWTAVEGRPRLVLIAVLAATLGAVACTTPLAVAQLAGLSLIGCGAAVLLGAAPIGNRRVTATAEGSAVDQWRAGPAAGERPQIGAAAKR
jgi:hypothetical protein